MEQHSVKSFRIPAMSISNLNRETENIIRISIGANNTHNTAQNLCENNNIINSSNDYDPPFPVQTRESETKLKLISMRNSASCRDL